MRPARILIVSPYFPPQNAVASLRVHGFAAAWSAAGREVTVLTTAKRPDQHGLDLGRDGFRVVEVPYDVPRWLEGLRRRHKDGAPRDGEGPRPRAALRLLRRLRDRTGVFGTVRMPDLTDYWVGPALRRVRRDGPWNVVVSSSGPYTAHLVARALRREGLAARWAADFRDLWVDNHIWRGAFPFTLRERALQRGCLRDADLVVTVSAQLAARLAARTSAPVDVIYNGFDREELRGLPAEPAFPDDGLVRLVYTGTFYPGGQDPEPLLRALALLRARRPEIAARLRLVTAGCGREHWLRLARRHDAADAVDARDLVDRSAALRMQRDADALLLLDWRAAGAGVLTGKLFEYLNAGAPVLGVGGDPDSPPGSVLRRARRGVHLGTDTARIAAALTDLAAGRRLAAGPPDRAWIERFSRRAQSRRFLELIETMRPGGSPAASPGSPARR